MFKLPNKPTPKAGVHELADFAELLCWINGSTSAREIIAYLGRLDDNEDNEGCEDNEDKNTNLLDEVMIEIDRRASSCKSGYPFILESEGTVLKYTTTDAVETRFNVYLYLLVSTRLNMKDNRNQAGIDGTELLETLSAHALRIYLGPNKARSFVLGTSNQGTFKGKVSELCDLLGEGSGFNSQDNNTVQNKDDALDVVAWIPFADNSPGQLIVFAQCKTGTNWKDSTSELQPDVFIKRWVRGSYLVNPVRVFCVSEAVERSKWKNICFGTGILFDRCRLVECSDELSVDSLTSIGKWTLEAKKIVSRVIH